MKYSFMSFSCPELNLAEALQVARRYGYDGFEPRVSEGHKHGIEADSTPSFLSQAGKIIRETGIAVCCVATSCALADPMTTKDNIEQAKRYIDVAERLGAPAIRVFGGMIPSGVTRAQSIDTMADSLLQLSDEAQKAGIKICVETHDHWCDPLHLAAVMTRVNRSSIAVNWDIMHPVVSASYTMEQAFEAVKPWIGHVHVHDATRMENRRILCPIGEGLVDHRTAITLLGESGYDGYISGEWIGWEPYEMHLPRELSKMKALEAVG